MFTFTGEAKGRWGATCACKGHMNLGIFVLNKSNGIFFCQENLDSPGHQRTPLDLALGLLGLLLLLAAPPFGSQILLQLWIIQMDQLSKQNLNY